MLQQFGRVREGRSPAGRDKPDYHGLFGGSQAMAEFGLGDAEIALPLCQISRMPQR